MGIVDPYQPGDLHYRPLKFSRTRTCCMCERDYESLSGMQRHCADCMATPEYAEKMLLMHRAASLKWSRKNRRRKVQNA